MKWYLSNAFLTNRTQQVKFNNTRSEPVQQNKYVGYLNNHRECCVIHLSTFCTLCMSCYHQEDGLEFIREKLIILRIPLLLCESEY